MTRRPFSIFSNRTRKRTSSSSRFPIISAIWKRSQRSTTNCDRRRRVDNKWSRTPTLLSLCFVRTRIVVVVVEIMGKRRRSISSFGSVIQWRIGMSSWIRCGGCPINFWKRTRGLNLIIILIRVSLFYYRLKMDNIFKFFELFVAFLRIFRVK